MGESLWLVFKFCFSTVLVLLAGLMALTARDYAAWGIAGGLLFFAAVPWIDLQKATPALGLAGIVVAIVLLFMAYLALFDTRYPRDCSVRVRRLGCEFFNLVYEVGGNGAVAAVWLAAALGVLYGAYVAFRRSRRGALE